MRKTIHGLQTGVTLLELMTALAIFAIVVGLGVPSLTAIINNNRTTSQANQLVGALNYARSEAVKRADAVSVCSSTNGSTCAASTNWTNGWIVFTDAAGAAGVVDPPNDEILQVWPATGGLVLNAGNGFVRYTQTGMAATVTAFSLYKGGCSGDQARTIAISTVGRVSSAHANCPP